MEKLAMIIINPSAGKEKAKEFEDTIIKELESNYSKIEVRYTKGAGDATKFAKDASKNNYDLVVALGGDGTVNETVNGLAGFDKPPTLGIIPMGTVNDLARALKIPMQTERAIKLLSSGHTKQIDIGLANDRYFTNVLAVGNAAKAIHNVDVEEKSRIGPLAYVIAVAKEILEDDNFTINLEMDNENWTGDISVLIIGLIGSFGGNSSILSNVGVGDGNFHIFAIKRLNVAEVLKMAPSLIMGRISESDNVSCFSSKNIKISTKDSKVFESDVDGERGPDLPLTLKLLSQHLTVISNIEEK